MALRRTISPPPQRRDARVERIKPVTAPPPAEGNTRVYWDLGPEDSIELGCGVVIRGMKTSGGKVRISVEAARAYPVKYKKAGYRE
jgi:hypothetical protein